MSVNSAPSGGLLETSGLIVQSMEVINESPNGGGSIEHQEVSSLPQEKIKQLTYEESQQYIYFLQQQVFHYQQLANHNSYSQNPTSSRTPENLPASAPQSHDRRQEPEILTSKHQQQTNQVMEVQQQHSHRKERSEMVGKPLSVITSEKNLKRKKCSSESEVTEYGVEVSSRFDPLADLQDNGEENETISNIKIPPIFIHEQNYSQVIDSIHKNTSADFTTKPERGSVKVMFTTIEDFRKYRKFCENKNIQFHSFKDPSKNNLHVVIKDLPTNYSENEILKELKELNYPILKVCRLYNKDRNPIPVCAIDLEDNYQGRRIFNLVRLFYSVVKVQKRIASNVIQCKRCQRFGHSQANCGLNPRCVKCTGNHHYSECRKSKNTAPECVNCNQNHTSNYKGCPEYKKALELSQKFKIISKTQGGHTAPVRKEQITNHPPPRNLTHFPSLPKQPLAAPRLQFQPQDLSNLISNITTQVLNAIIPQIQTIIHNVLEKLNHGK